VGVEALARRDPFDVDLSPRPKIDTSSACYPQEAVPDAESLWASAMGRATARH
jgi:hypothetical protein